MFLFKKGLCIYMHVIAELNYSVLRWTLYIKINFKNRCEYNILCDYKTDNIYKQLLTGFPAITLLQDGRLVVVRFHMITTSYRATCLLASN